MPSTALCNPFPPFRCSLGAWVTSAMTSCSPQLCVSVSSFLLLSSIFAVCYLHPTMVLRAAWRGGDLLACVRHAGHQCHVFNHVIAILLLTLPPLSFVFCGGAFVAFIFPPVRRSSELPHFQALCHVTLGRCPNGQSFSPTPRPTCVVCPPDDYVGYPADPSQPSVWFLFSLLFLTQSACKASRLTCLFHTRMSAFVFPLSLSCFLSLALSCSLSPSLPHACPTKAALPFYLASSLIVSSQRRMRTKKHNCPDLHPHLPLQRGVPDRGKQRQLPHVLEFLALCVASSSSSFIFFGGLFSPCPRVCFPFCHRAAYNEQGAVTAIRCPYNFCSGTTTAYTREKCALASCLCL